MMSGSLALALGLSPGSHVTHILCHAPRRAGVAADELELAKNMRRHRTRVSLNWTPGCVRACCGQLRQRKTTRENIARKNCSCVFRLCAVTGVCPRRPWSARRLARSPGLTAAQALARFDSHPAASEHSEPCMKPQKYRATSEEADQGCAQERVLKRSEKRICDRTCSEACGSTHRPRLRWATTARYMARATQIRGTGIQRYPNARCGAKH